jgi:hypothetical protein
MIRCLQSVPLKSRIFSHIQRYSTDTQKFSWENMASVFNFWANLLELLLASFNDNNKPSILNDSKFYPRVSPQTCILLYFLTAKHF